MLDTTHKMPQFLTYAVTDLVLAVQHHVSTLINQGSQKESCQYLNPECISCCRETNITFSVSQEWGEFGNERTVTIIYSR
jgi:hypothetical protein